MVTQAPHYVAIVAGNGYTKARSGNKRKTFSSVIAPEQGGIKFDGLKGSTDFVMSYAGQRFAIGDSAYSLSQIQTVRMDRSRICTPFYKQLFIAALISVVPEGGEIVAVITLPLQWYDKREEIKAFLKESYEVKIAGKTIVYDVTDVRAVPEGFGVLCFNMIDDNGVIVDETFGQRPVGVIEIGTGTTDLSFFDGLKINRAKSAGLPHGLGEVWMGIGADISSRIGRDLELHEVDRIIRDGGFFDMGEWVEIAPYVDIHMPSLADYTQGQVGLRWGDRGREASVILVAGGGCTPLYDYFDYPHAIKSPKPWMTDMEGIYRYLLFKRAMELQQRK